MSNYKGKFISVEGCEGVGKSTQVNKLKKYFEEKGYDILFIREPGGTYISEEIRKILLSKDSFNMDKIVETTLYMAARKQLLEEKILPALNSGKIVLCDRFFDSTLAYQGIAREIGEEKILNMHKIICNNVFPDITFFLDLKPEDAFKRKGGADKEDRIEQQGLEFHNRVYKGYKLAKKLFFDRIKEIDAKGNEEEIFNEILKVLRENNICI